MYPRSANHAALSRILGVVQIPLGAASRMVRPLTLLATAHPTYLQTEIPMEREPHEVQMVTAVAEDAWW